ncbi:MAG: TolC family outer membrane protein [Alphaproteobacteria bacterium]
MTTKTIAAALLLASTVLAANAQTMQQAVQAAITEHPDVLAANRNQSAIGYAKAQAKAGYRPTIDLVAGTGWEHSNNSTTRTRAGRAASDDGHRDLWRNESRLTIRQMLFDGFETRNEVTEQGFREESAAANVTETKELLALAALEAYLDVMRARELVAVGQKNLDIHTRYLNQITERSKGGRGSMADVQQAEGRAALAHSNLLAFEGDLRKAESGYLQVVGAKPADLKKDAAPFSSLPASLDAATDRAMANNSAIKSAQADIKAADAAKSVAKSAFSPRLDLEGGISRNVNLDGTPGTNNDHSVMLMLRHNLYRGNADTNRVRERAERFEEAKAGLEQSRRLVEENMMNAWSDLQTSKSRLEPLNAHVEASSRSRDAYQEQFDLGQRTLLDLLDSEVELFNAQTALINGKYAVDLAAYSVMAHSGELVGNMGGAQVAATAAKTISK